MIYNQWGRYLMGWRKKKGCIFCFRPTVLTSKTHILSPVYFSLGNNLVSISALCHFKLYPSILAVTSERNRCTERFSLRAVRSLQERFLKSLLMYFLITKFLHGPFADFSPGLKSLDRSYSCTRSFPLYIAARRCVSRVKLTGVELAEASQPDKVWKESWSSPLSLSDLTLMDCFVVQAAGQVPLSHITICVCPAGAISHSAIIWNSWNYWRAECQCQL